MQNPFESGHIKNYILLYVSVVVIMILFFIAATLFRDTKVIEEKFFSTEQKEDKKSNLKVEEKTPTRRFKLMEKVY
jgi:low affinity Fe/Cu permease